MKLRLLSLVAVMSLAIGLLTAAPAAATIAVQSITFPGGLSEFYSPFSGPATITFTFDGTEADATYSLRIRPAGNTAVHTQDVLVDADDPDGFQTKAFNWPALTVNSPRTYEVAVYRSGALVGVESFQLLPRLVAITGASPNPFLPWITDGYKDTTTISYRLAAASNPTLIRIYKANADGKCCGPRVFFQDEGSQPAGTNQYMWNGRTAEVGGTLLPKGPYFVKVTAEDASNVVKTSRPFKVSIARTYRANTQVQKDGILMHHTGPVTSYRRGGNCFVTKDETDRDLWITCLSASFTVYWRWNLPPNGRIESASFVYVHVSSEICNGKKGHTTTDSYLKVGGVGQFRCRVDKAKITYSRPVQS